MDATVANSLLISRHKTHEGYILAMFGGAHIRSDDRRQLSTKLPKPQANQAGQTASANPDLLVIRPLQL